MDVEASSASPGSAAAGCMAGKPLLPAESAGEAATEITDGAMAVKCSSLQQQHNVSCLVSKTQLMNVERPVNFFVILT